MQSWCFQTLVRSTKGLCMFICFVHVLSSHKTHKHPLAYRLEHGLSVPFPRTALLPRPWAYSFLCLVRSLSSWPAPSLSWLHRSPASTKFMVGGKYEVGKISFCSVCLGSYPSASILCLRPCLPPYQQPTGTGDGGSSGDLSPSLLFLVQWHFPADRQSYLCRLKWRWHRPLSCPHAAPSAAGEHWAMLLAPAAAHQREKSGSRTAMLMQEVSTLQVKAHKWTA